MTILVSLSGGLDSTWVLQHLLKEKRDPIAVYHCDLKTIHNFHDVENRAADAVVAWCDKNIRPIKWYKKTTVDTRPLTHGTHGPLLASQAVGCLENDFSCSTIATGQTITENHGGNVWDLTANAIGFTKVMELAWNWTCMKCPTGEPRGGKKLKVIHPCYTEKHTKKFMKNDMDPELFALTWSCIWPVTVTDPCAPGETPNVYTEPCGHCYNCVNRGDIRNLEGHVTVNGPTINDIIAAGGTPPNRVVSPMTSVHAENV